MRWVVISGHEKSLMAYAYGPFDSMEKALEFLNARPPGHASNLYQLMPTSHT
jgi:hypothetical protein